jgi:hypothetical protein
VESLRSACFLETKTLFTLTKKIAGAKTNDSAKDIANYWIINVSTHDISSRKKVRKVGIGTR